MIPPSTVYFVLMAVFAVCLALWPEFVLGKEKKARVQANMDNLGKSYGSGIAVFIVVAGFTIAALAWPWIVLKRLINLIFPTKP